MKVVIYTYLMKEDLSLSKQLGLRIKELREAKNIKQFELAEFLEMEPTNLSKIENGVYMPREEKLRKIASFLGVEIKDLFDIKHIQTRTSLINSIHKLLETLNDKELMFYFKILQFYREINNKN